MKSLKDYIYNHLHINICAAAREIGNSRQHLGDIINGNVPAGRRTLNKIIDWSSGQVDIEPLLKLNRPIICNDKIATQ